MIYCDCTEVEVRFYMRFGIYPLNSPIKQKQSEMIVFLYLKMKYPIEIISPVSWIPYLDFCTCRLN